MMKFGKSGYPLNVYKTDQGLWRVYIRNAAGRLHTGTFLTWRDAITFANSVFFTFEVPPWAPTRTDHNFAVWKIRRGLNVRANRKGTIEITASKPHQSITVDEALNLAKAALSSVIATEVWERKEQHDRK